MALRVLIVLLALAIPMELPGCGPWLPEPVFFQKVAPESPDSFAAGQLGILQPTYGRLYQVIAYRHLMGIGLNDAERAAVFANLDHNDLPEAVNTWDKARATVVHDGKRVEEFNAYRTVQRANYFNIYLNCNADAFVSAAATLDRLQKAGAPVADWIAAQDQVFSNCWKGAAIPDATSDPGLRPDRVYQIAAAKFYSEQYEAARADFTAIAADQSSPWRELAPYLAARCLLREEKYSEAQNEFQKLAADPTRKALYDSAVRLASYADLHARPQEKMHALALALVKPNSDATIGRDLTDYRALFDKSVQPQPQDDLTEWIASFQAGGKDALAKWHERRTLPWLIASLQATTPRDSAVAELLAAAAEIRPESPGYLTVNYHRVRLMPPADARTLSEQLLSTNPSPAAANQFRAERMRLARDFDDFLKYASRSPVDDEPEARAGDRLDEDSGRILDRAIPLRLLKKASVSSDLPQSVRDNIASALATREIVLSKSPRFDDVFRLLHTPGLMPFVRYGYGRPTANPSELDMIRQNWWCALSVREQNGQDRSGGPEVADFLPPADQAQADAEWRKLSQLATGPDWLGEQTLAFARTHPADPRVPEALHLVVRATRYGCADAQTGDYSRQAFDLLHRRYPDNEWTKKTPYWFKG